MRAKKLYKSNVVYVAEIHGCHYYVGCHCWKKGLSEYDILIHSGNPLEEAYRKKLITHQEYMECCRLVHVEEYDSKEEALNREAELIEKFKEHYGNLCLNKSDGNKYGQLGVPCSDEAKRKLSESHINNPKLSKRIYQYTKDGQLYAEYPSIQEAERRTGISFSLISKVISKAPIKVTRNGKDHYYILKSAGGYLWERA